jgi:pilus assembly protein FimV
MRAKMKPLLPRLWMLGLCLLLWPMLASSGQAQVRYDSAAGDPFQATWLLSDSTDEPVALQLLAPNFPVSPAVEAFLNRLQVEPLAEPTGVRFTHPYALPFEPVPVRIQFARDGRTVVQSLVFNERDIPRPSVTVIWGDTLWAIALTVRPDASLTPQQVMLAIQDLNPDAFLQENINWVLAERRLRLPTRDEILSRSVAEAIAEVRRQNEAFAAARQSARSAAAGTTESGTPQDAAAAEVLRDPDGFLEVLGLPEVDLTQPDLPSAPTIPGVQALRDELSLQREMKLALERQMHVHQERLNALDGQLQTLTQLVRVELATAAQLQASVAAMNLAEVDALTPAPEPDSEPLFESERSAEAAGVGAVPAPWVASARAGRPQIVQWLQHGLWILGLIIVLWLAVIFWRWRQVMGAETSAQRTPPTFSPEPESKPAPTPEPTPEPTPAPTLTSDEDPVQVQLELAEVYTQLGDLAAARDILEQVLTEGSAEQQAQAQALLERLPTSS